jgi:2-hydroxychromene-2-carboxylate isomerase
MVHADSHGLLRQFALGAMRLSFLEGADLGETATVLEAGRRASMHQPELEAALTAPLVKQTLREVNDEALALGVFGVPTVAIDGELFWGDDRLDEATDAYRALSA